MQPAFRAAMASAPSIGGVVHHDDDIFGGLEIEMAPQPKRRKINPVEDTDAFSSPVIFLSPGLQPDVRLTVYGKYEFHLHSVVLKLHSNYFRRFLERNNSASAEFQYEYVSAKGEEGWVVEPEGESTGPWEGKAAFLLGELNALKSLFCAFYNRPYPIESPDELKIVTNIADYYCALPILSATLNGALYKSSMFRLLDNPLQPIFTALSYDLIFTARKLRHAGLFRECFIHIVGTWMDHRMDKELIEPVKQDPELVSLINAAYIDLCRLLLEVNQEFLVLLLENILDNEESPNRNFRPSQNSSYYRNLRSRLHQENDELTDNGRFSKHLDNLLKNNLVFDRCDIGNRRSVPMEGGNWEPYFLCGDIKDEDLPWDMNEVDF